MEKADPDIVEKACNQVDSVLNARIPLGVRIKFPLVWARMPEGIRVADLHEDKYNATLEHIKSSYMVDEPCCRSLNLLEDQESVAHFSERILSRMRDTQSLIALKEDEDKVVGCLIERVVDNLFMKTMSRMSIYEGSTMCKLQRLRKHILKSVNLEEIFGSHRCNDIYIWSVDQDYRNRGIGTALLEAAIRQTKLFHASVLCGIFTSDQSQAIAKRVGFQPIKELLYSSWVEAQEIVIEDPGENNYAASFMAMYFEEGVELKLIEEGTDQEEEEDEEGAGAGEGESAEGSTPPPTPNPETSSRKSKN